jgi:hypothetical protein
MSNFNFKSKLVFAILKKKNSRCRQSDDNNFFTRANNNPLKKKTPRRVFRQHAGWLIRCLYTRRFEFYLFSEEFLRSPRFVYSRVYQFLGAFAFFTIIVPQIVWIWLTS